jgi:anti-anti-sigma factor
MPRLAGAAAGNPPPTDADERRAGRAVLMTVSETTTSELRCSRQDIEGISVIRVVGEIDLHTAPILRTALDEVIASQRERLVLDLRAVSFMDCSGINVLVAARRGIQERDSSLCLVAPPAGSIVGKLLHLTGLHRVLQIHHSVEEAHLRMLS